MQDVEILVLMNPESSRNSKKKARILASVIMEYTLLVSTRLTVSFFLGSDAALRCYGQPEVGVQV